MQSDVGGTDVPLAKGQRAGIADYSKFCVLVVEDQEGIRVLIERVIGSDWGVR